MWVEKPEPTASVHLSGSLNSAGLCTVPVILPDKSRWSIKLGSDTEALAECGFDFVSTANGTLPSPCIFSPPLDKGANVLLPGSLVSGNRFSALCGISILIPQPDDWSRVH